MKLDFEQRQRARELADDIGNSLELDEFCQECIFLRDLNAAMREVVDIARGLTIERDPERSVYVGVTGDHKDAQLLDEALRKLDALT